MSSCIGGLVDAAMGIVLSSRHVHGCPAARNRPRSAVDGRSAVGAIIGDVFGPVEITLIPESLIRSARICGNPTVRQVTGRIVPRIALIIGLKAYAITDGFTIVTIIDLLDDGISGNVISITISGFVALVA